MQFRYTLIDYTTNPAGVSTIVPEPVGWDGLSLKLERDKEYHGFFEYTDDEITGLKFYDTGYKILKKIFDGYGIEANVDMLIEINCTSPVDAAAWQELFRGRIDFDRTRYSCGLKGCFAETSAAKSSCLMALRNRFDQKVDLDSLKSFSSTTNNMEAYPKLNFDMQLPEQSLIKQWVGRISEPTEFAVSIGLPAYAYLSNYIFQIPYTDITSDTLTQVDNLPYINPHIPFAGVNIEVDPTDTIIKHGTPFMEFQVGEGFCSSHIYIRGNFDIVLKDKSPAPRNYTFIYRILKKWVDGTSEIKYTQLLHTCTGCSGSLELPFTFDVTTDFVIYPGEKLFFYFQLVDYEVVAGPSHLVDYYDEFAFSIMVNSSKLQLFSPSNCGGSSNTKVYMVNEALSRTAEAVTDGCLRVYSNYFGRDDAKPYRNDDNDGCGSLAVITNGLKIRNAYMKDGTLPRMQISFKDLIEGLNAIHCIGYGVEPDYFRGIPANGFKLLRVEPFSYFYDNSRTIHLCPNVPNLKTSVITDEYISTYKTGYAKWEAEEEGGLDDFFGQREYRTILSTINKTLDKVCKFIASGYSTEVTRQQIGTDNTDWRYDNETFIICVKRQPGGIFTVDNGNITGATNLFDTATVINAYISPVRIALRWCKRIAQSVLPNWATPFILNFTAGQGNFVAATKITNSCKLEDIAATIPENANLRANSFADDKFGARPVMYNILDEFEYPLSYVDYHAIITRPYGMIQYSCNDGEALYGFIKSITYKPTDGKATFQLIRAYLP